MSDLFTVAFTGHRPIKLGGFDLYNPLRDKLMDKLEQRLLQLQAEHRDLRAISGVALGFDQWAAELCSRLGISWTAAVPHDGHEKRWPESSQQLYRTLLAKASRVVVVSPGPYMSWKMQKRNVWMVDRCDHVIAAWNGSLGGTANCVRYAAKVGRSRENLLPPPLG